MSSFGLVQFFRSLSCKVFVELILKLHVGFFIFVPDMGFSVIRGEWISRRVRLVAHVQVETKQISTSITVTQKVIEFAFFLSSTIWSRQSTLWKHLESFSLMISSSSLKHFKHWLKIARHINRWEIKYYICISPIQFSSREKWTYLNKKACLWTNLKHI